MVRVINDEKDKANVTFSPWSIFNRRPADIRAAGGIDAYKACFHPILRTQRASPWCKVIVGTRRSA